MELQLIELKRAKVHIDAHDLHAALSRLSTLGAAQHITLDQHTQLGQVNDDVAVIINGEMHKGFIFEARLRWQAMATSCVVGVEIEDCDKASRIFIKVNFDRDYRLTISPFTITVGIDCFRSDTEWDAILLKFDQLLGATQPA